MPSPRRAYRIARRCRSAQDSEGLKLEDIDALADEIKALIPMPVDMLEVTAILESRGITDAVAVRRYGARDAFELGEWVFQRLPKPPDPSPENYAPERRQPGPEGLLDYARGMQSVIPGLLLVAIIQTYGSLGTWREGQIIVLSLGVASAMLIANGFSYAVSPRGSIYLSLGDRAALRRLLDNGITLVGAGVVVLAGLILWLTGATGILAPADRILFGLTFAGVSAILLLSSGLSLVQASGWLGLALSAGLILGLIIDWLTSPLTNQHLVIASTGGFSAALGLMVYAFRRHLSVPAANGRPSRVVLPSAAFLIYEAGPYFAYGSLYMVMILIPHFLGWFGALAKGQAQMAAVIAIELGLTASLPPTLLLNGMSERALRNFWRQAITGQQVVSGRHPEQFGDRLRKVYWQQFKPYLPLLVGSSLLTWLVVRAALHSGLLESWLHFPILPETEFIFLMGLLIYALLAFGLYNCMFCNSLARPEFPLRAVILGIGTILVVGAPLSLGLYFVNATLGFAAGAFIFAGASYRSTQRVLRSADYHYFAAF